MDEQHFHACHMKCIRGFADVVPSARAERAEAAIERGLRLANEIENGPGVAHLRLLIAQQLRAALDVQLPAEERSDEGPKRPRPILSAVPVDGEERK